jgi:hypothetical protein
MRPFSIVTVPHIRNMGRHNHREMCLSPLRHNAYINDQVERLEPIVTVTIPLFASPYCDAESI